jgi:hypothetical protein
MCRRAADNEAEAEARAEVLSKAGLVLRFNGMVYLRPEEVSEMVYRVSEAHKAQHSTVCLHNSRGVSCLSGVCLQQLALAWLISQVLLVNVPTCIWRRAVLCCGSLPTQLLPTDPQAAERHLAAVEQELAHMDEQHKQINLHAKRWPRRWLVLGCTALATQVGADQIIAAPAPAPSNPILGLQQCWRQPLIAWCACTVHADQTYHQDAADSFRTACPLLAAACTATCSCLGSCT